MDDYLKSAPIRDIDVGLELMGKVAAQFSAESSDEPAAQILRASNIIQLESGTRSALILNSPETLSISPAFTNRQCKLMAESNYGAIVLDREFVEFLLRDSECGAMISRSRISDLIFDGGYFSVIDMSNHPNLRFLH